MITHLIQREDAVIIGNVHSRRYYVPTIYGDADASRNTKWVGNMVEFRAAGGCLHFNEDHTEITLTLPPGYKFGCGFDRED
jgi:hypothetical protein